MKLRPSDRDRFHRYPLKVDGFPDPRRLPSAGSSFEPFSDLAATRATTQVSAPFRPLRVHRFGLGPFPRPQPRPRTASGARHRLPTSATNPQNKGTPGKRRFHARSSPFRRSPFAPSRLGPEAASGTAPELSLPIWRRLGRRRTGRKTTSQRARSGAEADSTACRAPPVTHSVVAGSGLPATLNERAEACFRPAARTGELSADRGAFDR